MNWFSKLKNSLKDSSTKLSDGIISIIKKRKLDESVLEDLEELLITADMGVAIASQFTAHLAKTRFNQEVSDEEIKTELGRFIEAVLRPVEKPLEIIPSHKPHIILMVGVNGSGKTTTIAKLAAQWKSAGHQVRLVAGDTFRAAAVEQLEGWAQKIGVPLVKGPEKADAASLAYQAIEQARKAGDQILIIDTAGRLQNKSDLMAELEKIKRVIQKLDPQAPHHCLLTLDATLGQNAHSQVEQFQKIAGVNGLIMTKLDGTARGGVLVSLAQTFQLPIYKIGLGEKIEDLKPFSASEFARSLVGLETLK